MELDYYEVFGVEAAESDGTAEDAESTAADIRESTENEESAEPDRFPEERQNMETEGGSGSESPENFAGYEAIHRRAQQAVPGNGAPEGMIPSAGLPFQSPVGELSSAADVQQAVLKSVSEGAWVQLEKDLKIVQALDPSVKSMGALAQRPEYPEICRLVEKGLSLPEAYKLVNFDALSRRRAEATRQAALNQYSGKQHMRQSISRGSGAVRVPADIAEEYRMFLPDATNAEIQAHYNGYVTKQ